VASVRSLDNALEVTTPTLPQAKITNDDGSTHIPDNGRIIRNLIHGADTVMSHITHFYALSALDFVDASNLGPTWDPTYVPTGAIPGLIPGTHPMPNTHSVVGNYVESLTMRRKAHTMAAIFSGRHPIQNAIVPGGVTTLPTASDVVSFANLLDTVRNFINTAYVPDVVYVATLTTAPLNYTGYWALGTQPGNLLSYGEYPVQSGTAAESLLLDRGLAQRPYTLAVTGQPTAFLGNVVEHVDYSYYDAGALDQYNKLKPSVGVTNPKVSLVTSTSAKQYSWLKAPRFRNGASDLVCEVGPLPRMYVSYLGGGSGAAKTVSGAKCLTSSVTVNAYAGLTSTYTLKGLVDYAVGAVAGVVSGAATSSLISILGRHACRALECKFVADAMADTGIAKSTGNAWLSELRQGTGATTSATVFTNLTSPVYVYAKLPTKPKSGAGWAEAPRGALGHWISIEKKKITNYQCVVPTTWNHSPMDANSNRGPAEQVIMGLGTAPANLAEDATLTIIRALHTYDFCIACAVHVVRPDGSTISKFKMETDGKVTKLPLDAEI